MVKKLVGLKSETYEHPFDREALNKLKKIPGVDTITNFLLNWTYVNWHLIELQGSHFRITHESCPELYSLIKEVEETLDITDRPKIYTKWGYNINGYTTGTKDNTLMMLNSGSIDLLSESQLKYIIGHEMGHIKSNHVLYHMMAEFLPTIVNLIPGGNILVAPIQLALLYWQRMSELTADRAGLLACQDKEATLEAIVKMAGLPQKYFDNINEDAFLKQAEEFEKLHEGFINGAMANLTIMTSSHPWTVFRAAELVKWINSGAYDSVLSGLNTKRCIVCETVVATDTSVCPVCGSTDFEIV